MKKTVRILSLLLALLFAASLLCACSDSEPTVGTPAKDESAAQSEADTATNKVRIVVKDFGEITAELYPEIAPITVKNFKKLVAKRYYDGTLFHRVIDGFMIQGGAGASTDTIKGEFKLNGVNNDLSHERGVLSMARANPYNSASSQFFICQDDYCKQLDGKYAAFGRVLTGLEVVDKIVRVETDKNDRPLTDVVIESITFI